MAKHRASTTAAVVGWARSVSGLAARQILPPLPRLLAHISTVRPATRIASDVLTAGLVTHLHWRTAQIDHAVSAAIARGARQCVVVGAGYDDRAHRLEALSRLPVWELDHPASQRAKRDRTGRLYTLASQVVYVALDLSHEDLAIRLLDAGFNPAVQTVWIWEGCTMYLPTNDIATCLEGMASISAPSSTLVSTYALPQLSGIDLVDAFIAQRFQGLGEPLKGLMSDADWQNLIAARGWRSRHDHVQESAARAFRAERVHQATRLT